MALEAALFDSVRNDHLELIILPTEQCNFRCTYCYETFKHKKMPVSVVRGIKALLDRRAASLSNLHLSWFGGEPMLAFDVISDICAHAIRIAADNSIRFTSSMTTNGYFLDNERFTQCLDNRITDFQISLDGGGDLHDATRKLASGAGTFDRIWANIVAMKSVRGKFLVNLRLHYTSENYARVGEFAKEVKAVLGDDPRFHIFFKSITRMGGPNDQAITMLSRDEQKQIERVLYAALDISKQAGRPADVAMKNEICYAAKANSLIVRSTGRLGKCTVALTSDFNTIGQILESGELVVDQEKFQRWIAPLVEGRTKDVGCPLGSVARESKAQQRLPA